jgi:uncharacterized RDD family membrane protein YckC
MSSSPPPGFPPFGSAAGPTPYGGPPPGVPLLATRWRRLGGALLEGLLFIVTLGIGWVIWSLIVWGRGQTPAKQLLNMRVLNADTGERAHWGRMALRFLTNWVMQLISIVGLVATIWILWDDRKQTLWDKVVSTVVVHET